MPITNDCFLNWSSKRLSDSNLEEIDFRNILSRAYYSAYHSTLELAEKSLSIPCSQLGGSTHKKLSELLIAYKNDDAETQKTVRRLGARISVLHSLRVRADYFLDETVQQTDAESIVKNVTEVLHVVAAISTASAA